MLIEAALSVCCFVLHYKIDQGVSLTQEAKIDCLTPESSCVALFLVFSPNYFNCLVCDGAITYFVKLSFYYLPCIVYLRITHSFFTCNLRLIFADDTPVSVNMSEDYR